jgi:hypothetical protein
MDKVRDEQKGAPKKDAHEDRRHHDDQRDDRDGRGTGHLDQEDDRDRDEAERPNQTEPRR